VRRAVIATVGTVVGLAALLSYKSSGTVQPGKVSLAPGGPSSSPSTSGSSAPSGPSTSAASSSGTSAPSTGTSTAPSTSTSTSGTVTTSHTYVGQQVTYLYGSIEVSATVKGSEIVNVAVPENEAVDPRSQMINSEAVPLLIQEAEQAQGLNFDVVSGATFTSDAFAQSLQSALDEAKK
jgi:uncharacterized protein with FMN-binding domain